MKKIQFIYPFIVLSALIISLENTSAALSIIAAMVLHEFGHIAAISLTGGTACGANQSGIGAHISYIPGRISKLSDIAIYISGPCAGAIGAIMGKALGFEFLYRSSAYLTLLNLLPAMPFDGGCITHCLLPYDKADKIQLCINISVGAVLSALGLYSVANGGNFTFLASGICVFAYLVRKTPLQ